MQPPNRLHDQLDVLLEGRVGAVPDDLAPLLEAADALRAELAAFELDPRVVDRHLERVLDGSAAVAPLPTTSRPGLGWRRRMAAVALAAALLLAPATMASASSLPGQPLYPVKLAVEQIQLGAVQWSATREASTRTEIADTRLEELARLVELEMMAQIPAAVRAADRAVAAAAAAVADALDDGAGAGDLVALNAKLDAVRRTQMVQFKALQQLPGDNGTLTEIKTAVDQSQVTPPRTSDPVVTTAPDPGDPPPPPTTEPTATDPPPPPPTTQPDPPPVTEEPPAPDPTTTEPPPPSTAPEPGGATDATRTEQGKEQAAPTTLP